MKNNLDPKVAAMAQMAGGVGHELGNILLRIMGKIELAQMESDPEQLKKYLDAAMAASERMTILIRNLQSFSRVSVHAVSQDLVPVIYKAMRLLEGDASKYKGKIRYEGPKSATCLFDQQPMLQVINNLTLNSLQSMPKGGEVVLRLKTEDADGADWLWLEIEDQGIGMNPGLTKQAFEWGFTTRGARGAGLGLPIARDILEEHHAKFELQSEDGKGTIARIGIPKK